MAGHRLNPQDQAVLGLAAVAVGTAMFTKAGKRMGWRPIAISLALYGVGRLASLW